MSSLALGKLVPDFKLPSTGKAPFHLKALRGNPVVLYFYPISSACCPLSAAAVPASMASRATRSNHTASSAPSSALALSC
jgi:peroxiredoxin